jgi:hypothetical protein
MNSENEAFEIGLGSDTITLILNSEKALELITLLAYSIKRHIKEQGPTQFYISVSGDCLKED